MRSSGTTSRAPASSTPSSATPEAEAGRPRPRLAFGGLALGGLALAVPALALLALSVGRAPVGPLDVLSLLLARPLGLEVDLSGPLATIVLEIRLPRVLGALLVGAALAAAGTAYQGLFRNPLVSPDILGVAAGAGFGAVVGIFLGLPVLGIQLLGFLGGIATVLLVGLLAAAARGHEPTLVLVLAGVVAGTLAGSCVSLLKILADPYEQLPAITFWLLGSLAAVSRGDVLATLPAVVAGLVPLLLLRHRLDVLTLGEEEARALGVAVGRTRLVVIASATLATAAVTAIGGVVGWIGLVVPHLARLAVGPAHARLLPTAALGGAGFLLLVDTAARTIAPTEVPLGVLTSFLGAPLLVWLLARGRRSWS